jgi:hypothetical protein
MNPEDDDLPRHITSSLPRPVYDDAPPDSERIWLAAAAVIASRPGRTCRTCGAALDRTEAFCSVGCFRRGSPL